MTLLIDQNEKLEIPNSLREALHLESGSQVKVELDGESIVLTAVKPAPELKCVGKQLMWTGEVGAGINEALEQMREDRAQEVSGF